MTATTLLYLFAILAGGACFIAFLTVILVLVYKLIVPYDNEPQNPETFQVAPDEKLTKEQLNIYTNGIMRGSSVVFVGLYKSWKDNNDVPLIGSFDDLRTEVGKNLDLFNKDGSLLTRWVEKYNQHFKDIGENK